MIHQDSPFIYLCFTYPTLRVCNHTSYSMWDADQGARQFILTFSSLTFTHQYGRLVSHTEVGGLLSLGQIPNNKLYCFQLQ